MTLMEQTVSIESQRKQLLPHAKELLDRLIQELGDNPDLQVEKAIAYNSLGRVLTDLNQFGEAVTAYEMAIALKPEWPIPHYNLGIIFLVWQNQPAKAEGHYRTVVVLKPDWAEAHDNLGIALQRLSRPKEAEAAYRQAIRLQPNLVEAYDNLSVVLVQQRRFEEALDACQRAIGLKPARAESYAKRADVLVRLGRLDDGVAAFRKAIALDPNHASAHANLANALGMLGRYAEALDHCDKAIALKPDYAFAHYTRGQVLRDQGRYGEALQSVKKAVALDGRDPHWGPVYAEGVKIAEPLAALEAKLLAILRGESRPTDAEEYLTLAQLCQKEGQQLCAASARFYAEAFAGQPKLAEDTQAGHRYNAACAAALAGCGQGKDASALDDAERRRWRQQALAWLRADLEMLAKQLEEGKEPERQAVQRTLRHWQQDSDLAGLGDAALAKLPQVEQEKWQQLWADVTALLQKTH